MNEVDKFKEVMQCTGTSFEELCEMFMGLLNQKFIDLKDENESLKDICNGAIKDIVHLTDEIVYLESIIEGMNE